VKVPRAKSPHSADTGTGTASVAPTPVAPPAGEVVAIPILSLQPGESPRLNGEDKAHIARLAGTDAPLPPILVDRRTMRVIDGMHRLMAASLQGRETIDATFFDGGEADAFLQAVRENVTHGLPLSLADRKAAAERIITSHPHMSDRALAGSVGLSAKTIAAIRKRAIAEMSRSNARVGKDGKVRPLDSREGRRRAAEILGRHPQASLRDAARAAGISPATARDVRKRITGDQSLISGESSVEEDYAASPLAADSSSTYARGLAGSSVTDLADPQPSVSPVPLAPNPSALVQRLMRDPSLRSNEQCKAILRMLHINAIGADQLPTAALAIPPHSLEIVVQLARQYADMWRDLAGDLDRRAQIIDPLRATP
jgi:ParB-like chromosome segregation protein Spo0J